MRRYLLIILVSIVGLASAVFLELFPKSEQNIAKKSSAVAKNPDTDQAELEKLAALPYTNWSNARADIRKKGVIHFEAGKTAPGINLYNSRNLSEAYLMDMNGKIIHSWFLPKEGENSWHSIHLLKNGDLFAVVKDQKLIRLSWHSTQKWEYQARVHHDVDVAGGLIYVPTRRTEMWTVKGVTIPIVKESITVLNDNGHFVKEINLFDALRPFITEKRIEKIRSWAATENIPERLNKKDATGYTWWENKKADVFHLNSIQFIPRTISGIAQVGDFLLSVRQLDLICIFRPSTGRLIWSWGPGEIQSQHHARLLENNNILLFDNGSKKGYSRVLEINPGTRRIVWEYKSSKPKEFFSRTRGGVQRLSNGNTLITESDRGRVFEVTPDGKIVWEFLNPDVYVPTRSRAVIYRLIRIPEEFLDPSL